MKMIQRYIRRYPVITHKSVIIHAPRQAVWDVLTDIRSWKEWVPGITSSSLERRTASGAVFRWRSHGLPITSTVQLIYPPEQISWAGKSIGVRVVHVWHLETRADGTYVSTEEEMVGPLVLLMRDRMKRTLDESLSSWVESLKQRVESES